MNIKKVSDEVFYAEGEIVTFSAADLAFLKQQTERNPRKRARLCTHRDVNDVNDCRLAHALNWLGQRRYGASYQCLAALQELCAQTGNGTPPNTLLHRTPAALPPSPVSSKPLDD